MLIAWKTSYFSAASANPAKVSNSRPSTSGSRRGYTNWNRSSRIFAFSVNCVISPRVSNSDPGNAPVFASRYLRCKWNNWQSTDRKVTSASGSSTEEAIRSVISRVLGTDHQYTLTKWINGLFWAILKNVWCWRWHLTGRMRGRVGLRRQNGTSRHDGCWQVMFCAWAYGTGI